jgi:leader peptidase (prepilin peptidase)/N-methyltransferase
MLSLTGLRDALSTPLWECLCLALGLILGSFANVVIHRLPLGQSVVRPRSRCPRCETEIRALDNLPVLSYLLLGGRCRSCRAFISPRYPAVEALNGLLYLVIALLLGPTPRALVAMLLVTALLILSLIDLEHQILPDAITKPGILVGLAASLLPGPPTPLESVASAAGGYLALMVVAWLARRYYKEEALGQGDWKMVAMLGAFLGWQGMLAAVLLGSLLGSLVGIALVGFLGGSRRSRIPLGTFLAVGGIAMVLAGDPLLGWYRGLFHV